MRISISCAIKSGSPCVANPAQGAYEGHVRGATHVVAKRPPIGLAACRLALSPYRDRPARVATRGRLRSCRSGLFAVVWRNAERLVGNEPQRRDRLQSPRLDLSRVRRACDGFDHRCGDWTGDGNLAPGRRVLRATGRDHLLTAEIVARAAVHSLVRD